jgi:hypothetical protein
MGSNLVQEGVEQERPGGMLVSNLQMIVSFICSMPAARVPAFTNGECFPSRPGTTTQARDFTLSGRESPL